MFDTAVRSGCFDENWLKLNFTDTVSPNSTAATLAVFGEMSKPEMTFLTNINVRVNSG